MGRSSRANAHLTTKNLDQLKDNILAEIERITTKHAINKALFLEAEDKGDDVDSANGNILKNSELRFATRETLYLKKLKKSLNKITESDEYGICEDCGAEILFARLMARPTSDLCISCKEESERDELNNALGRQSKSLGRQVDLVKKI